MPETDEQTIGFRTAGTWTGQDLISFTTAVTGIYNALVWWPVFVNALKETI